MDSINNHKIFTKNAIEAAIQIAILGVMVILTFKLIKPFMIPVIWGTILAVAMEPLIARIAGRLGGRRTLTSVLFVLMVVAVLIIPTGMLIMSSIDTAQTLTEQMQSKAIVIPPPPSKVADWPFIGNTVHQVWQMASINLEEALKHFSPQIKTAVGKLAGSVGGGLAGLFMIIISTCIAGVFLAKSEKCSAATNRIITRFAGERGEEITSLATATIRGVMLGVVGVAVIQASLAAIGMVVVGVPIAGLWTLLVLICAVIQLPPILILGPVAAYVFSFTDTTPAVLFLVWSLLISVSDAFLKPVLMGRGVDIPMLVILLGALGGMVMSGIIGLFVGAIVLAIMYTLFMAWLDDNDESLLPGPDK